MATQKQIEANRRNALHSTGPSSPQGKAVSRMNALKTGIDAQSHIIRGEDPAALEQLTRQYYERFEPQGPEECDLIDAAISSSWLLRRLRKTEAEIWNVNIDWDLEHHPERENLQARAYAGADRTLDRCHARIAAAERSLRAALETLARLRKQAHETESRAGASACQPRSAQPQAEPIPPDPPQPEPPQPIANPAAYTETNPILPPAAPPLTMENGASFPVSRPSSARTEPRPSGSVFA
jgi:hypothetical protein